MSSLHNDARHCRALVTRRAIRWKSFVTAHPSTYLWASMQLEWAASALLCLSTVLSIVAIKVWNIGHLDIYRLRRHVGLESYHFSWPTSAEVPPILWIIILIILMHDSSNRIVEQSAMKQLHYWMPLVISILSFHLYRTRLALKLKYVFNVDSHVAGFMS